MAKAKYAYIGKDSSGREVKGLLDASSRDDAINQLKAKSISVTKVDQQVGASSRP
jgi:type II secretory pathway component PulF